MTIITGNWTQDILLYLIAVFLGLYLYVTRNFSYWKKMGIKEISPIPFFGNVAPILFARKHLPKLIEEAYAYGKGEQFVGLYSMDQPYLLIRDPELIKLVFIKDFNNFSNRIVASTDRDTMGNPTLFLSRNPPWRQIRQLLSPPLSTGKIKKMFGNMYAVSEDFETYCNTLNVDEIVGKPVEVKEICARLATDFICMNAYSIRARCLTNPKAEFRNFGKYIFCGGYYRYYRMLAIFFVPILRHIFNPYFFDVATPFFRKTFWDSINYRMKTGEKGNDMIDVLVDLEQNQHKPDFEGLKLEGDKLVGQAGVYFTGGFETSSTTITFALYEMANNPDIQEKLRQEIFRAMDKEGGKVTWDLVASLPYLHWCILETLRKFPVLPWLDRIAEDDYTFPGTNITIKKGTPVLLPMRALQMDSEYYPNPEKFIPERWSEDNKRNHVPYTFFPFGDGPRNCIGERLGLIQSKYGLLNFVTRFEISPTKQTPYPMKFDVTNLFLSPQGGLYLHFKKIVK